MTMWADVTPEGAGTGAVAAAVLSGLVYGLKTLWESRRGSDAADRKEKVDEFREVIKLQQARIEGQERKLDEVERRHAEKCAEYDERIDALNARNADCDHLTARLRSRLEAIDDWMANTGVKGPFRPFDPDGSASHRALPPDSKPTDRGAP